MNTYFVTPGLIPLEAFSQFAVNAKPNTDNPIGHFGTGLKYVVAIILRNGGTIKMWRGGVEYEFYTHKADFRGKAITNIRLRKKNGLGKWLKSIKLPFTTELGKNWGLWQAYREMLSNTIDENGMAFNMTDGQHPGATTDVDKTVIMIDIDGFDEAQKHVYLPHSLQDEGKLWDKPDWTWGQLQVWRRPSDYIYFKGVRVHQLPIPSYFTYNFTGGVVLSEDRSLMNQYGVMETLARAMDTMGIDAVGPIFEDQVTRWFEAHELSYYTLGRPTGTMALVAQRYSGHGGYYLGSLVSAIKEVPTTQWNFDEWLNTEQVYEFVVSLQNGDVEDTEVARRFKAFVNDNSNLLTTIRSKADEEGVQLPFDLVD